MLFRRATAEDAEMLTEARKKQLIDEGAAPTEVDREMRVFFHKKLSDGSLVQWICEDGGAFAATGGIIFYELPPSYANKSGIKGYITNMYTAPAYRGQGLATQILDKLAAEATERGISQLWLGASKMGRPVYEKYGFRMIGTFMELNFAHHQE